VLKVYRVPMFRGLATLQPATKLKDGYLQQCRDVRLDLAGNIRVRNGDENFLDDSYLLATELSASAQIVGGKFGDNGLWIYDYDANIGHYLAITDKYTHDIAKMRRLALEADEEIGDLQLMKVWSYIQAPSSPNEYKVYTDCYEVILNGVADKCYIHTEEFQPYVIEIANITKWLAPMWHRDSAAYMSMRIIGIEETETSYRVAVVEDWIFNNNGTYTVIYSAPMYATVPEASRPVVAAAAIHLGATILICIVSLDTGENEYTLDLWEYDVHARTINLKTQMTLDIVPSAVFVESGYNDGITFLMLYSQESGILRIYPNIVSDASTYQDIAIGDWGAVKDLWGFKTQGVYIFYLLTDNGLYKGNSLGIVEEVNYSFHDDVIVDYVSFDDKIMVYSKRPYVLKDGARETYGLAYVERPVSIIPYQDSVIILRYGEMPLVYWKDTGRFERLSIDYTPAVAVHYETSNDSDPGDTLAFCYSDTRGRRGPWAIVKIPYRHRITNDDGGYAIRIRHFPKGYIDNPNESRGAVVLSLEGYILNEATGGQFTGLGEDKNLVSFIGNVSFTGLAVDDIYLTGNPQIQIGQFGVLPPQYPCPDAAYGAIYKGRLFVANAPDYPNRIWWSDLIVSQFDWDYWWLDVPDGEEITALKSYNDILYIFTRKSIYLLTGEPPVFAVNPDSFAREDIGSLTLRKLVDNVGCINSHTLVTTPYGLVFLTALGVYLLTPGGLLKELSVVVKDIFTDANNNFDNAYAVYYDDKYYLAFKDTSDADMADYVNNRILIYDFRSQSWWLDKYPCSMIVYDIDNGLVIGSGVDGKLYKYDIQTSKTQYWTEQTVDGEIVLAETDCGIAAVKKHFVQVTINGQLTERATEPQLTLTVYVDNTQVHTVTLAVSELNKPISLPLAAYGEKIQVKLSDIPPSFILKSIDIGFITKESGGVISEIPSLER